ncbi:MAG: class I SAM-dependent methyltransferase [Deltaproteobacteria bacterium]|nr:class I SAM-dependent methyltransferase [Deltaproteobacteria bacterium]
MKISATLSALLLLLFGAACAHAQEAGHGGHAAHASHAEVDGDADHKPHGSGHHRFDDADAWAKTFENPERDAWQRPDEVLAALAISETAVAADIGSATGYFPVRMARLASGGRVWGVDVEPDMVRFLNERARKEGLANLFSILGTFESPLLPEPVDLILMVDTYHHIEARPAYFRRLQSSLKPGGRIAIVDFKMGEIPVGPPESRRLAPEVIDGEMREAGYTRLTLDQELLPYQYLAVYGLDEGPTEKAQPEE